jgi:acyl homoserine lactone synthase
MIEAFSLKTAHHFGDALASQSRLRYRAFVQDRGLSHACYEGMEYDEFDTPAAVYLVWRDPEAVVRGVIRLMPTTELYMAERYWPGLFQSRPLPKQKDVWETSRVCVDRKYPDPVRKRIMPELLCGLHEFCEGLGITAVVGVTRRALLDGYLPGAVQWLCEPTEVEGNLESAFWTSAGNIRPTAHCEALGIASSVLTLDPPRMRVAF